VRDARDGFIVYPCEAVSWKSLSLSDDERQHVQAFGTRLRTLRAAAGMTQLQLGLRAEISEQHVGNLECGRFRTRASTVQRLVVALLPEGGDVERAELATELLELLGSGVAPESPFAARQAKSRARKQRRREVEATRFEWWLERDAEREQRRRGQQLKSANQ
jgi:transcriptional regulator with XRE-family HTH domain